MPAAPLFTLLTVPGLNGSGEGHWQTAWERAAPPPGCACVRRVHQCDWARPQRDDWVAALDAAVRASEHPVIIVAHSLGCALVAHHAAAHGTEAHTARVRGALLVAPSDVERPGAPAEVASFAPVPLAPLPCPSLLVASTNDAVCSQQRAAQLAAAWRAELLVAGAKGHINAASGLGDWPQGQRLLQQLIARVTAA